MTTLLRFSDLKSRNIVRNSPTLLRWIDKHGFPPGRYIGPNSRTWTEEEVEQYLASRPSARTNGEAQDQRVGKCPHRTACAICASYHRIRATEGN